MSDTPETNKARLSAEERRRIAHGNGVLYEMVPADFARRLERERDEAREALAARTKQIGVACMKHDLTHALGCGRCLDEARDVLRELVDAADDYNTSIDGTTALIRYRWAENRARAIVRAAAKLGRAGGE